MDERRRFPPGSLERIIYEAEAEYGNGGRQNRAHHPQRDNVSLSRPQFNARASTATIVSSVLSARSQVNSRVAKSTDQYSDRLQARQNEDRVRFDAPPRPQRPLPPPKPLPARIAERNRQLKEQNILSQVGEGPERRGTAVAQLRSTDRIHSREQYSLGCIFSAPDHVSANQEMEVDALDPARVATPYGVVLSKYRKQIVIATHGTSVATLPIYTHNGRGLEYKRYKNEHVSIRDLADEFPSPPETEHGWLYACRFEQFTGNFLSDRASIHLIDQRTHSYHNYATMEGQLDDVSLTKLQMLLAKIAYERFAAFETAIPSAGSLLAAAQDREEGEVSEDEVDEMGRNLSLADEETRRRRCPGNGGRTKKHTTGFTWSPKGLRKIVRG